MQSGNLSLVYFIRDTLDEKVFFNNSVKNQIKNIFIATPENYNLQFIKAYKNIKIKDYYSQKGISTLFENINTDWIMIMRPEEAFIYQLDTENLEPAAYTVAVEKFLTQDRSNNLIYGDVKLFHRNYKNINKYKFTKALVLNYTGFFPEIEKAKLESAIDLFRQGDRDLPTIMYLLERRIINISPENLFKSYYNENDKSPYILEMLRYLARYYIVQKDFDKAKEILFKALLSFPNSPCINSLLAEVHFMQKDYTQAENFILNCIKMGRENSFYMYLPFNPAIIGYAAHYYLGKIYFQMGDYIKSKLAYEDCLEINPNFKQAILDYDHLKNTLAKQEDYVNELNFACQGCGNCCRNFQKVNISHYDILNIINNKPELKIDDFVEYIYDDVLKHHLLNLKKRHDSIDCVFLEDNKCKINSFKPLGCKVWPFMIIGNDIVTWTPNNRLFIKNNCAYKEIEGSNNKDELVTDLKIHDSRSEETTKILKDWAGKISNSENKLNSEFVNYLKESFKV